MGRDPSLSLLICGENSPILSGEVWEGAPHSWQSSPRASGEGSPHRGPRAPWERCSHGGHRGLEGKGHNVSHDPIFVGSFSLLLPWKRMCHRMVSSWGSEGGGRGALRWGRGGRRLKQRSAPPSSPGAQALECYSCVQRADDGCSPQKTKTVKCAPGVEVCTEAVGAVETSEWGPPGPRACSSKLLQPGPAPL